ncbi:ATP-dependent nuclease [Brevibacillus sp. NRS-1366]|uniref:ATP-dependent nuclease n=1 Tax=Brevibacillus sp. NRS-1366 TaxID=3233899 RepID=UPI003D1D2076
MFIKSIIIRNFRSIEYANLQNLSKTNCFIGKNNAGKSNLLKAIRVFSGAVISGFVYSREFFTKEDIRNGEDILIQGIISNDENDYLVCVGSKIIHSQVFTYSMLFKGVSDMESYDFKKEWHEYGDFVGDLILSYERISKRKGNIESYLRDIASLPEEEININPIDALNYIDENFELSNITKMNIKRTLFTTNKILEELKTRINNFIENAKKDIESESQKIEKIKDSIKAFWEKWYYNGNRTRSRLHFYHLNNNISIPKLLIKTMNQGEKKSEINEDDARKIFELKNTKYGQLDFGKFKQIVKSVLDIEIDVYLNSSGVPNFELDKKWINLNGTGVKEVLRLLLDMETESLDLVLIEEPEIHLHFELEQKLSNYFNSTSAQIFLTTHSTAFVENAWDQSIYLVIKNIAPAQETFETKVNYISGNLIVNAAKEVGINVNALLIKRSIIFVEGKSDELIIRHYIRKYYSQLNTYIGFVDMNGESNYRRYAEASSMQVFKESGMQTYFILDSDNMTQETKKQRIADHPEGSTLDFWNGHCIENLFIYPTILQKYIKSKTGNSEITIEEVNHKINSTLECIKVLALKKYVGEKYLRPIAPNRSKKNEIFISFDEVKSWYDAKKDSMQSKLNNLISFEQLVSEFEEKWDTCKGELIPGDKFMDVFCKEFGEFSYHKDEQNINHLTKDLDHDEWPSEIRNFVTRIKEGIDSKKLVLQDVY